MIYITSDDQQQLRLTFRAGFSMMWKRDNTCLTDKPMIRPRALLLLFLFFLGACSGMFFYPSERMILDPAMLGLAPEEIRFESDDGTRLSGWFFRSRIEPVRGTVIQFHGNAQNMTSHYQSLVWMIGHGYHLFTFDYRGYGSSAGRPTIPGVIRDAVAAMKRARDIDDVKQQPIVLYGQSLGGIVLLRALEYVPDRDRITAVVLEGAFLSYQEIAREKMSEIWLTWPLQHLAYVLFSDTFAAEASVRKVSPIPLLIIHGSADPVIPFRFGEEIYRRAAEPKTFWPIPGGGHIDAMLRDNGKHRAKLLEYLQD